jgi:hypothetical protein
MTAVSCPRSPASGLGIQPVTVEADAHAGDDYTGVIRLGLSAEKNDKNAAPEHIQVHIADWDMKPDGSILYAHPGTMPQSCAQWIQVNPTELDIAPGQVAEERYTVHLPKDLPDGDYRAIIFNQTRAIPVAGNKQISSVSGAIGTILYLSVGPHSRRAKLLSFTANPRGAALVLSNCAADHLRVNGTLKVEDRSGATVDEFKLPPTVILPGETHTRNVNVSFPSDFKLAPGQYTITALIDYGGDAILGARRRLVVP